ncbi:hypothetical protein SAMN02745823_02362 [Sporobacter termitidis DSM 10068]|uniref:YIEGIA protein n=1 Tax=Sporobacter termitidis DSM 10068 TaxID=1123282 RepID=A0A1M5YC95_9FIRM|nr:YIEGIA domain-containing protein [Sporobacter termitidis]SHI09586.1 hypothetical protein SAMN02745823_02362 [Sporobacter termitidis DSM 10068]
METAKSLSAADIYIIVTGIVMGTAARLYTLKIDMRQIPSYPSAYFNNIILGFIAAALGAIAVPAFLARDFVAVTFLTIAVQQFRDIRSSEQESLEQLEETEYIRRGAAYIDGISKTFESRNYLSMLTALISVLLMKAVPLSNICLTILLGAAGGMVVLYFSYRFTKGRHVGQICAVSLGSIEVRGSELFVDGMFVTNYLGTDRSRELFRTEGLAVVLTPRDPVSRVTLENAGQRQAVLFEAVRALGVKRYKFMKRNFDSGKVLIAFVPILNDPKRLVAAVKNTPILENSRKIGRVMKTTFEEQS